MEVSLKDIKELLVGGNEKSTGHPYKLGEKYFIRTITMYYTGKMKAVYDKELVMTDVSWVADTGRFNEFLKSGSPKEVEPYPSGDVIIGRGAILDVAEWSHELPRSTK